MPAKRPAPLLQDSQLSLFDVAPEIAPAEPGAARALGDDFVRLVKTIAATEPTPGDDLGPGDFDYVVHISTPTNALVARGGKSTSARAMNW